MIIAIIGNDTMPIIKKKSKENIISNNLFANLFYSFEGYDCEIEIVGVLCFGQLQMYYFFE